MKPSNTYNDALLMQLISVGDERAFEVLYDRYKRLIFSLLLNMIGDRSTAEDVMLDVFTQIWRHAGTFQPRTASVKTWLTTIARRKAIDAIRYRKVRLDLNVPQWSESDAEAVPDPSDLAAKVETHDLENKMRSAIAELPRDEKEALALAYFKGYSHSKIAKVLKQPLGSVKTKIRRGMQQLRERFKKEK